MSGVLTIVPRKRKPLYFIFLGFLTLFTIHISAHDYYVRTPAEIAFALPFLLPGDTLTMADGVWQDADIRFRASANVIDSILLRAETSGQVILTGNSRLRLYGSYLIVKGLYFKNGSGIEDEYVWFSPGYHSPPGNFPCRSPPSPGSGQPLEAGTGKSGYRRRAGQLSLCQ